MWHPLRAIHSTTARRTLLTTLMVSLAIVLPGAADEPVATQATDQEQVFSGPQPGEVLPGLPVQMILENDPSRVADVVADKDYPHRLIIFVHQLTRPGVAFTRTLGDYAATRETDGLKTAVVFLGADATELTESVRRARNALPQSVAVGISQDGLEGPGSYGLNRNMTLTILVASEGTVKGNFALVDPSMPVELPKVLDSLCKVVGGEPPTVESLLQKGNNGRPMQARGKQPNPADTTPPGYEKIEPLLRRLIRKETVEADVDKLAADIDEALEGFPLAQKRLKDVAGRVHNIYGTDRAQYHLRRWAEIKETPPKETPPKESPSDDSTERDS